MVPKGLPESFVKWQDGNKLQDSEGKSRTVKDSMNGNKKKIIYGILAVLCFAVLAGATFFKKEEEEKKEFEMVVLGDSIMGQIRDETAIPYMVGKALDMTVYNGALGGTCMGRLEESVYPDDTKDVLSFASLSKSIVSGDFTTQMLLNLEENGTQHFPDVLWEISQIDFSEVEVLLVCYGVNDYHAGEKIYPEDENPYDENTYVGALCSGVRTLQSAYPELKIVLVTPTYTWYPELGLTCEEYILGDNTLEDYVNATIYTAEKLGLEIVDAYHIYSHDTWEKWMKYTVDGLHPNKKGRDRVAGEIVDFFLY